MLVSTILYLLGVPLWLILGMIGLALWNRNRVKKQPGIFPVKVKPEADPDAEKEPKWPRTGYAQWLAAGRMWPWTKRGDRQRRARASSPSERRTRLTMMN